MDQFFGEATLDLARDVHVDADKLAALLEGIRWDTFIQHLLTMTTLVDHSFD